jgi:hypothetical protein
VKQSKTQVFLAKIADAILSPPVFVAGVQVLRHNRLPGYLPDMLTYLDLLQGLGLTVFGLSLWLWWEDEFSDIIDYLDIYLIYWGLYLIILKAVLVMFVSFFACASALLENTLFLFIVSIRSLYLLSSYSTGQLLSIDIKKASY